MKIHFGVLFLYLVAASLDDCTEDLITELSNRQFSEVTEIRPGTDIGATDSNFTYGGLIGVTGVNVTWVSRAPGSTEIESTLLQELPDPYRVQYKDTTEYGFGFEYPSGETGNIVVVGFRPPEGGERFFELEGIFRGDPQTDNTLGEWVGITGGGAERAAVFAFYVTFEGTNTDGTNDCIYYEEGAYEIDTIPKQLEAEGTQPTCDICGSRFTRANPETIGVYYLEYGTEYLCSEIIDAGASGRITAEDCSAISRVDREFCCTDEMPTEAPSDANMVLPLATMLHLAILLLIIH